MARGLCAENDRAASRRSVVAIRRNLLRVLSSVAWQMLRGTEATQPRHGELAIAVSRVHTDDRDLIGGGHIVTRRKV
jgi:hypothetical protein